MTNLTRTITVGSSASCTLHVADDPFVSARHAAISQTPTGFYVEDLGSMNGTQIIRGGQTILVGARMLLLPGDRVRVGRTTLPWVVD